MLCIYNTYLMFTSTNSPVFVICVSISIVFIFLLFPNLVTFCFMPDFIKFTIWILIIYNMYLMFLFAISHVLVISSSFLLITFSPHYCFYFSASFHACNLLFYARLCQVYNLDIEVLLGFVLLCSYVETF